MVSAYLFGAPKDEPKQINTESKLEQRNNAPDGQASVSAPLYFGGKEVSDRVFLRRRYVFAMIADEERALVDGLAFVCPVRNVEQVSDLTELEYLEMFVCAQEVSKKFEDQYKHISSFQFIMHDGKVSDVSGIGLKVIPEQKQASRGDVASLVADYSDLFEQRNPRSSRP